MKTLVKLSAILLAMLISGHVIAQNTSSILGTWAGKLNVNAVELTLVFNVNIDQNDSIVITFDSPDQGVNGLPVDELIMKGDSIEFKSKAVQASYIGKLEEDQQSMKGFWLQSGFRIPLDLTRLKEKYTIKRSQDPKPPFSYVEEEVTFPSAEPGVTFSGTLTIPTKKKIVASVILISGSGPQNRDEELMGHKPFLVLADHLSRNGILVLRYDDRGVGKSTGNFDLATTADFAQDLLGAVSFLQSREEVDPETIGLLGHSEGGLISTIVAADNNDISYLILFASPAIRGDQLMLEQAELIATTTGVPEERLQQTLAFNKGIYSVVRGNSGADNLNELVDAYITKSNEKRLDAGDSNIISDPIRNAIKAEVCSPWFRYFVDYDPFQNLTRIHCPIYALFGELDLQVPPSINQPIIEKAMKKGGNETYLIEVIPQANHLFQPATTGSPSEYGTIDITISPDVLTKITEWIVEVN